MIDCMNNTITVSSKDIDAFQTRLYPVSQNHVLIQFVHCWRFISVTISQHKHIMLSCVVQIMFRQDCV